MALARTPHAAYSTATHFRSVNQARLADGIAAEARQRPLARTRGQSDHRAPLVPHQGKERVEHPKRTKKIDFLRFLPRLGESSATLPCPCIRPTQRISIFQPGMARRKRRPQRFRRPVRADVRHHAAGHSALEPQAHGPAQGLRRPNIPARQEPPPPAGASARAMAKPSPRRRAAPATSAVLPFKSSYMPLLPLLKADRPLCRLPRVRILPHRSHRPHHPNRRKGASLAGPRRGLPGARVDTKPPARSRQRKAVFPKSAALPLPGRGVLLSLFNILNIL